MDNKCKNFGMCTKTSCVGSDVLHHSINVHSVSSGEILSILSLDTTEN